jgi:hypothetical protein
MEALLVEGLHDPLDPFRLDQCHNILHLALSSLDGLDGC